MKTYNLCSIIKGNAKVPAAHLFTGKRALSIYAPHLDANMSTEELTELVYLDCNFIYGKDIISLRLAKRLAALIKDSINLMRYSHEQSFAEALKHADFNTTHAVDVSDIELSFLSDREKDLNLDVVNAPLGLAKDLFCTTFKEQLKHNPQLGNTNHVYQCSC